jgi:hypothetical protein
MSEVPLYGGSEHIMEAAQRHAAGTAGVPRS